MSRYLKLSESEKSRFRFGLFVILFRSTQLCSNISVPGERCHRVLINAEALHLFPARLRRKQVCRAAEPRKTVVVVSVSAEKGPAAHKQTHSCMCVSLSRLDN